MYKYYSFISCIFTATILISNTLDSKIFVLGPMALPAGIILFPLAYVFGDILTEIYGYSASRKVIWTGFFSLLLMVTSYEIAGRLPAAPMWGDQESFKRVLGVVPRIALASALAFISGEFCNSYVLAKMKVKMRGRGLSLRLIGSTVIGQAVDTTVFVVIAYAGVISLASAFWVALSGWTFKIAWEVVALPLTLTIVRYLKKQESEDYFDSGTDFNPFRFHIRTRIENHGAHTAGQNTVP